jgi:hypothetical protein
MKEESKKGFKKGKKKKIQFVINTPMLNLGQIS